MVLALLTHIIAAPAAQSPGARGGDGAMKLGSYHWWTAPGERRRQNAMFAALKDACPNIEVVEAPAPAAAASTSAWCSVAVRRVAIQCLPNAGRCGVEELRGQRRVAATGRSLSRTRLCGRDSRSAGQRDDGG
ncbi:MAG: hypothetical protein R3A10_12125 [Caldilineaceae bacterium]